MPPPSGEQWGSRVTVCHTLLNKKGSSGFFPIVSAFLRPTPSPPFFTKCRRPGRRRRRPHWGWLPCLQRKQTPQSPGVCEGSSPRKEFQVALLWGEWRGGDCAVQRNRLLNVPPGDNSTAEEKLIHSLWPWRPELPFFNLALNRAWTVVANPVL